MLSSHSSNSTWRLSISSLGRVVWSLASRTAPRSSMHYIPIVVVRKKEQLHSPFHVRKWKDNPPATGRIVAWEQSGSEPIGLPSIPVPSQEQYNTLSHRYFRQFSRINAFRILLKAWDAQGTLIFLNATTLAVVAAAFITGQLSEEYAVTMITSFCNSRTVSPTRTPTDSASFTFNSLTSQRNDSADGLPSTDSVIL